MAENGRNGDEDSCSASPPTSPREFTWSEDSPPFPPSYFPPSYFPPSYFPPAPSLPFHNSWPMGITPTKPEPIRIIRIPQIIRPIPCYVAPYLPIVETPSDEPMYQYLIPDLEHPGCYRISPTLPAGYNSSGTPRQGPSITPHSPVTQPTTVTTRPSDCPAVTSTTEPSVSIPAPFPSGSGVTGGSMMDTGPTQTTLPTFGTRMQPTRDPRTLERGPTPYTGTFLRHDSSDPLPEPTSDFGGSTLNSEQAASTSTYIPIDTNLSHTSSYVTTELPAEMQPTTEGPLSINVDPEWHPLTYNFSDPLPGPSTTDVTNSCAKINTKINPTSSFLPFKQTENRAPGLPKTVTQDPESQSPTSRYTSKPLKLIDFISLKLSKQFDDESSEMVSKTPSPPRDENSSPIFELELESEQQWPQLPNVKGAPHSEIASESQMPPPNHEIPTLQSAFDYDMPLLHLEDTLGPCPPLDPVKMANILSFIEKEWPHLPPERQHDLARLAMRMSSVIRGNSGLAAAPFNSPTGPVDGILQLALDEEPIRSPRAYVPNPFFNRTPGHNTPELGETTEMKKKMEERDDE